MLIRRAKKTNNVTLEYLNSTIFPEDHILDFDKDVWWIVTHRGKPVGFCGLSEFPREGFVFLKRAGVLYEHRGLRIHRKMIKTRLNYAKTRDFSQIITYTLVDNPSSANNLIKAGFRLYLPENRWVGNNALYWVKWL